MPASLLGKAEAGAHRHHREDWGCHRCPGSAGAREFLVGEKLGL